MSVWRVAWESVAEAYVPEADGLDATGLQGFVDRVVKWVPGDVLALYAAGVTAFGEPNVAWLLFGIALAPLLVLIAPFAATGHLLFTRSLVANATLAATATAVWTLTIPSSGWQRWSAIGDNPAPVAVAAAAAGLIFGMIADGVSKRLADSDS